MIHGHSDVAKISRATLSISVTAASVSGKSKKPRKKNRWRPYHVVPARTLCKFIKQEHCQPHTSKKRLRNFVSVTAEFVLGKSKKSRKKNRWQPYHVVPARTFCKFIKEENWQSYTSRKRRRSSSGCHEMMPDSGIMHLPNHLVVKILSNLDIGDISACRLVNREWHALVDELHLQARAFSRFLHYQPTPKPQTVENYHLSTRSWLRDFGIRGKELAEQLDELLEHKHFPEILFFAIAEVLAKTRLLACQNVCTIEHSDWVTDASFSPDGRHLVTASDDHTAQIWELVAGQWRKKVTIRHSEWVLTARFSPDGHYLLTAGAGNTAQIWELVAGQWQQKTTIQHFCIVRNASFSPDGRHLVIASDDNTAQIWELVAGQWQQKTTIKHSNIVRNASFSPDGRHLATASADSTAQIWELVAGQWQKKTTIQHLGWVSSASFSSDGHYLATVSDDYTAQIWELAAGTWQQKATLRHCDAVKDASFSPEGCHLATASNDGYVKIWSFVAGQWQEMCAIWHSMTVNHVSFSPDGRHLVMASEDHTVTIWGRFAGQWKEKATIRHTGNVKRARFSSDGLQLLTTSFDGTAKVWLLKSRVDNDIS